MKTLKMSGSMLVIPIDRETGEAISPLQERVDELTNELRSVWKKASNHESLSFEDCNRIRELINK